MRSGNGYPTVTSPVPRGVWESLLRTDQNAVVTQLLAWRDAVFASGRYEDVSLLYEFPSGRQVVLPLARPRRQPPWAAMVASWPRAWGVGGPITQEGRISPAEAAAVLADVADRGTLAAHVTLRHDADQVLAERSAPVPGRAARLLCPRARGRLRPRSGGTSSMATPARRYARLSVPASTSRSTAPGSCSACSTTYTKSPSRAGQPCGTSHGGSPAGG